MAKFNNLKGMGCYDSLQKCQKEPDIFLTIRYHTCPERRKNPPEVIKNQGKLSQLETELSAKILHDPSTLSLNFLSRFFKLLLIILFFPFDFCFSIAPTWVSKKIWPPVFYWLHKCLQPIVGLFHRLLQPIKKGVQLLTSYVNKALEALKKACLNYIKPLFTLIGTFFAKVTGAIKGPFSIGFSLVSKTIHKFFISLAWVKVMSKLSLADAFNSRQKLLENMVKGAKDVPEINLSNKEPAIAEEDALKDALVAEKSFESQKEGSLGEENELLEGDVDEEDEEDELERNAEIELWDALGDDDEDDDSDEDKL